MKSFRRQSATVNAGSMADIAFLLLIFFLVTTTISADKGILRKLPPLCTPSTDCTLDQHERNVLRIVMNNEQQISVDNVVVTLDEIKTLVTDFVDNNGKKNCSYCNGASLKTSSDHPTKAIISLQTGKLTKYDVFIQVQDEITKAYYDLRETYTKEKLNKLPNTLTKGELQLVKQAYPFIVSEILTK